MFKNTKLIPVAVTTPSNLIIYEFSLQFAKIFISVSKASTAMEFGIACFTATFVDTSFSIMPLALASNTSPKAP